MLIDDLNRHLTLSDYSWAQGRFLEICSVAGIADHCVGFFGNVSYPGISDIDALAIGGPHVLKALSTLFEAERNASPQFAEMFWHPPVYVLENSLSYWPRLHTLQGLKFENSDGPEELVVHRTVEQDVLLHLVWVSFLIGVVSGIMRGGTFSLRLLLLVYKNLEHSLSYFSIPHAAHFDNGLINSSNLRQEALASPLTAKQKNKFMMIFFTMFRHTIAALDIYCTQMFPKCPDKRGGFLVVGKSRAIMLAAKTNIRVPLGRFTLMSLNPILFALAENYLCRDYRSDVLGDYLQTHRCASQMYENAGMLNPFIAPCALPLPLAHRERLASINSWLGFSRC